MSINLRCSLIKPIPHLHLTASSLFSHPWTTASGWAATWTVSTRASCTQLVSYSVFTREIITATARRKNHSEPGADWVIVVIVSDSERRLWEGENIWDDLNVSFGIPALIKVTVVHINNILFSLRHDFFVPRASAENDQHTHTNTEPHSTLNGRCCWA